MGDNPVKIYPSIVNSDASKTGKTDLYSYIPKWAPYAIVLLTALIYIRVIQNDFVNIDDDAFILKNTLVRDFSWDGIKGVFTNFQNGKYQPFVNLSFLLEYTFFGFNPVVFHLTNVLLHLASTWVVYKFTAQLSRKQVTAIVVAALFALHPMHVEEVAWAAERKDVLYALFYLWAMLHYLKYLDSGFQWKQYIGVFLLFLASEFSKSTAMTLPLVLLAIDLYKGRKMNKRAWLEKLPFILVAILFAILGNLSQQSQAPAQQLPESINLISRIFLNIYVPCFYVVKLIFPFGLSAMHYYPAVTDGLLPWQYYTSLPLLLLLFSGILWLMAKRSPLSKDVLFGISFFAITIIVMEQIIAVGPSLTPERYTYIPYIGFFYIIGQWLANISPEKQKYAVIAFALFLGVCCIQTWARIGDWKNSDLVFKDVVQKNDDASGSFEFYFLRGDKNAYEGKLKEALQDYDQSIALNPGYAEAYTNRGVIYFQTGDMQSALQDYNKAIALKPNRAKPYENRAGLEATTGNFSAALKDYDHFLTLDSIDSRGYADRGMVRLSLGDTINACKDWKKSLDLGNKDASELIRHFCR